MQPLFFSVFSCFTITYSDRVRKKGKDLLLRYKISKYEKNIALLCFDVYYRDTRITIGVYMEKESVS